MEMRIDKSLIDDLKRGFHEARKEDKEFSLQYGENEFMKWLREKFLTKQ